MTKEEFLAEVAATAKTCRGPRIAGGVPAQAIYREIARRLRELPADAAPSAEQTALRKRRGELLAAHAQLGQDIAARVAEDPTAAAQADAALRLGCGYDINQIILAGPLDGDVHPYACPQCGLPGTYRAPLWVDLEVSERA